MIRPKLIRRLLHIQRVLVRHGLDELVLATHLFRPVRFVGALSPNYWLGSKDEPRGVESETLEDLGPIFVKFGQTLSTRRDLLPDDIAEELVKLQDRVPAFPGSEAKAIVEQALGQSVAQIFAEFDETPLASASVAQVHAAKLHDGQAVVVKVLRPGIEKQIRSDIALLYELARLAQRFWSDGRRLRPVEVVAEFEKTILDELDLVREAANAAEMRRRFQDSEILYIPKIYWPYTRRQVLVMERISGIPVGEVETLRREGVDFKLLAERGVEIFFTQVLRIVSSTPTCIPAIFCHAARPVHRRRFRHRRQHIAGRQSAVAENLLAFFNRDYRRVAEMHIESGWIPKTTRVEVESAIRAVSEPIFEKPLKDISYGICYCGCSSGPPLRHGSAAATGAATKDSAEHRRTWPRALSRPRSLADRETVSGTLVQGRNGTQGQPEENPGAISGMGGKLARDADADPPHAGKCGNRKADGEFRIARARADPSGNRAEPATSAYRNHRRSPAHQRGSPIRLRAARHRRRSWHSRRAPARRSLALILAISKHSMGMAFAPELPLSAILSLELLLIQ